MATEEPVFENSCLALVTFRSALETPPIRLHKGESLEAIVPAAAAWIEILRVEMHDVDVKYGSLNLALTRAGDQTGQTAETHGLHILRRFWLFS